ncbi:MAG: FtsW/RodA/SpoVE family cell cycle protein [Lachnospiraceae bacterium]|nr:FtsW/RodA/SpoVE family cell cycle protein [Lachnospiraceae bacterium]
MLYIFTEISKYLILGFMLLYVIECMLYEAKGERYTKSTGIYIRQDIYIVIIQALGYATLCLKSGKLDYAFFGLFVQIVLFGCIILSYMFYPRIDRVLLNNMALLLSIGFIILSRLDFNKALKQFAIASVSIIIGMFIPLIMEKLAGLKDLGYLYAGIGLAMLLIVLILGSTTYGSKINYTIAGITFQPSEIVKLIYVFCVAALLGRAKSFADVCIATLIAAIHVIVLVLSRDLGSGLIFFVTYIFMLFIATRSYAFLGAGFLVGIAGALVSYKLFRHVQVRVQAFINPLGTIDNQGYQISQSLFGLSHGSFFGTGLSKGIPSDIPFVDSDFIFSAISEEMGAIFAICMLLVCISCFLIMMRTCINSNGRFNRLVSGGFGVMYIFQVFLTVGGGIKFIPLTGVTLPLVSYGGTSMLASVIMFYTTESIIIDYREQRHKEISEHIQTEHRKPRTVETWLTVGLFSALYLAMIVYLSVYVGTQKQQMISNSYNSRQKLLAKENIRGTIYDRGGKVLAKTMYDENGKEYRDYPYGKLFAHVVGFSSKGKSGLEAAENYYLLNSNVSLSEKVENDIEGVKNPGNDVYTSLDYNLQKVASDAIGVCKGAVIVSEVDTGRILAMVSKPDFDPNTIVEDWNKYLENSDNSSVLVNRATQGLYAPGSTFKIVTALEYIRENPETYNEYRYTCNGRYKNGDDMINCYHGSVHGNEDLYESFAKSCNASFANIGMELDRTSYSKTLDKLMFNQKLPLDINYSISKLSVDQNTTDSDMMQIAIGQGKATVTPMELHLITNAIAEGGTPMKPYLVDCIKDADGNVIKEYEPVKLKEFMTADEAKVLTELMTGVVKDGTGRRLKSDYYQAAGKTGSAEFGGDAADSHAWFTGFAPADDPKISVTIVIESIGSGGEYAVPIAKRIIDAYFGVY